MGVAVVMFMLAVDVAGARHHDGHEIDRAVRHAALGDDSPGEFAHRAIGPLRIATSRQFS